MITPTQIFDEINADSTVPGTPDYTALTETQQLLLENLVKSYKGYNQATSKWPDLSGTINIEQSSPTDKTYFLKAVLTALDALPPIKVESSGTDKAPSFFSVRENWDELAQDVLNCLYELPIVIGLERFVLVQRRICDITLRERTGLLKDQIFN